MSTHQGPLYEQLAYEDIAGKAFPAYPAICLLHKASSETATHRWACSAHLHEWGPFKQRLHLWLDA